MTFINEEHDEDHVSPCSTTWTRSGYALTVCMCAKERTNAMNTKILIPTSYEREAHFLQALAHPVRLAIVKFLAEGPRCGCEIEPFLALDHSTISRHLATLKRVGALSSYKEGVKVMYRVRDERILELVHAVSTLVVQAIREDLAAVEAKMEVDHDVAA